jgi:DNA-binding protein HU-beta
MPGLKEVAKASQCSVETVERVIAAIHGITKTGEDVRIQGFGSFKKQHKEAYTGRNPATGDAVEVPAKDVLKFTPSKGLDMSVPKPVAARRR